ERKVFAYYCSGHGYGHATRVSAFTSHLLSLRFPPLVYIVSSALEHIFFDSISRGALYRHALIDPVIVQPLAYRVDRKKSVEVLKQFLNCKSSIIDDESRWLRLIHADCVLSNVAFVGCAAANAIGIPSALVTNFTFNSVYSHWSTVFVDSCDFHQNQEELHLTPSHSQSLSIPGTHEPGVLVPSKVANKAKSDVPPDLNAFRRSFPSGKSENTNVDIDALSAALKKSFVTPARSSSSNRGTKLSHIVTQGSRAQSLLMVPGAPPANIPTSPTSSTAPVFSSIVIPPMPCVEQTEVFPSVDTIKSLVGEGEEGCLLPDGSWIAIVCGVPKDWVTGDGDELPKSFFVAPKNVYMPDLTAVAEVLLGKLGYGTVSECVDACTLFVYVPRPLFIEEHELRLLLDKEGVGVELSRSTYKVGNWAAAVQEAYDKGKTRKVEKSREGETGRVAAAGKKMAAELVNWVKAAKG
ncbi:hypothetical protein BC835DRAFT_1296774, partial [Cytidiella melzeri]